MVNTIRLYEVTLKGKYGKNKKFSLTQYVKGEKKLEKALRNNIKYAKKYLNENYIQQIYAYDKIKLTTTHKKIIEERNKQWRN